VWQAVCSSKARPRRHPRSPRSYTLTGSEVHRARLGERASERGLELDRVGLVRVKDGRRQPIKTEMDLYRHLGLPYLPPEVREDEVDLEMARCRADGLVQESDIQGMVHCHTVYSDGAETVEVMARAAQAMGTPMPHPTSRSRTRVRTMLGSPPRRDPPTPPGEGDFSASPC
jgi:hypothetical protein